MENKDKKLERCTVGQFLAEKSRYYDASYKMDMINEQFGSALKNGNKAIRSSIVLDAHDKKCDKCSNIER